MNVLDTDYDNFAIFYQCFENISKVQADKTLKPVHAELVSIAHRNANLNDADFDIIQKRVLAKLTDLSVEDFTR